MQDILTIQTLKIYHKFRTNKLPHYIPNWPLHLYSKIPTFIITTCTEQMVMHYTKTDVFIYLHKSPLKCFKPATGRPYVRAFSLSGTVPAFTCDCLRFVCAFTRRRKFDLCVSTYSRTMLAFGNNVSFSSSECSTLAFCRR